MKYSIPYQHALSENLLSFLKFTSLECRTLLYWLELAPDAPDSINELLTWKDFRENDLSIGFKKLVSAVCEHTEQANNSEVVYSSRLVLYDQITRIINRVRQFPPLNDLVQPLAIDDIEQIVQSTPLGTATAL